MATPPRANPRLVVLVWAIQIVCIYAILHAILPLITRGVAWTALGVFCKLPLSVYPANVVDWTHGDRLCSVHHVSPC